MKFITFLFSFILLISTHVQAVGHREALPGKEALSESDQNQFLRTIEELGFNDLLDKAAEKLNLDSPRELFRFINYCHDLNPHVNGHFSAPPIEFKIYSNHYDESGILINQYLSDVEVVLSKKTNITQYSTEHFAGFTIVRSVKTPQICLQKERSTLEITATLLHEIFHLVQDDLFEHEDIIEYSEQEYIDKKMNGIGAELDAHLFNIFVAKKIKEIFGIYKFYDSYRLFIDEQDEVRLGELREYLLNSLNYHEQYSQMYHERRSKLRVQFLIMERYFRAIEVEHKKALEVAQGNLELSRLKVREAEFLNNEFDVLVWQRTSFVREVDYYEQALQNIQNELTEIYGNLDKLTETAINLGQNTDI
jgi:hypothetical protein